MDDAQLDRLLASRSQEVTPAVTEEVTALVAATRAETTSVVPAPRLRRRRWAVSNVALGAVTLTAGATLTAAQLNLPPFQTLEPGVQRVLETIPVDHSTHRRAKLHCPAFLEYRNLTPAQLSDAGAYVISQDWSSFGQQAYDAATRTAGTSNPNAVDKALGDILDDQLTTTALDAVPAASANPDTTGPVISGHSMSCATGQR